MPDITERPPQEIEAELAQLRAVLDNDLPAKTVDQNLLIATWNLRAFGDLTDKWTSSESDSPKRNLHALRCIAEIISRFDVIAIQEVKENLKCLRHLFKLEPFKSNWGFILTDVTKGDAGNGERMAYLFDRRKVNLSGLACELVIPKEQFSKIDPDALQQQFARTPYAVSFACAGKTFILVTLHVIYGKDAKERVPELKAIAEWLDEWASSLYDWDHNLIALGDFNIDRKGDALYQAFTSTGLTVPPDLNAAPRTIFTKPGDTNLDKYYDQIAWFTGTNKAPKLSLNYVTSGNFDFVKAAMQSLNLTKSQLSFRISDHYPLWAEFSLRD